MASSRVSVSKNGGLASRAWRTLCSIRLSVILLSAILVVMVAGSAFPQLTPEIEVDETARAQWLAAVQARYGPLGGLCRSLGLFKIQSSPVFALLVAALLVNGTACTVNRLRSVWRYLTGQPQPVRSDAFYQSASNRASLKVTSIKGARESIARVLSKHRYRVLAEQREETTYIGAHKNRFARLGTLVTHSALLWIALGVLWSNHSAWRESSVILGPGQLYDVGHGHHLQVRHEGFEVERYPDGAPKDYRSHLTVLREGREAIRKTIRVNEPLTYQGVTFYLWSSGPALRLVGWDTNGQPLAMQTSTSEEVARGEAVLNFRAQGDQKTVYLPSSDVSLRMTLYAQGFAQQAEEEPLLFLEAFPADQNQPILSDYVYHGQTAQLPAARLQFFGDYYSELQVVSDPGFTPVIAGSFLGMGGLVISFYFYPSRLWAKLTSRELLLAGSAERNRVSFESGFAKLVEELEEELQ